MDHCSSPSNGHEPASASKVKVMVNGQLLGEEEYGQEEDEYRPANLNMVLGYYPDMEYEYPIKIADLNVFNSSLSFERMVRLTTAGDEECGAPGNLNSWEEAEWTLHSQARVIEVDREWEGPCWREPQVHVFMADSDYDCMRHCAKIGLGRSPPVTTEEEWENLTREVDLITQDRSYLLNMWLSATEGEKNQKLARLDHWPDTELIKNEKKKLEAAETIWRDFYTGHRLDNWTKPYDSSSEDTRYGDTHNCMRARLGHGRGTSRDSQPWHKSWYEWECISYLSSCPCSYPAEPLIRMQGLCKNSLVKKGSEKILFTPKQLPGNPRNMILLGQYSTRIEYNDTSSQWVLTDAIHDVTAVSRATKTSYLLGKHKWTISNDDDECNEG